MTAAYEEVSIVSRVECAGPMTIERIQDARHALGVSRREASHVRAHPQDVNDWRHEVHAGGEFVQVECLADGCYRWAGVLVHPDARLARGQWVVETETVRTRRALS